MTPPPLQSVDFAQFRDSDIPMATPIQTGESEDRAVRVLHVDDDPGFADVTAEFLERAADDVTVLTETSAQAGLDRLAEESVDCIVSDYDMPRMNGLEFLDAVREREPELPFILFTGKGSEEVASEAIKSGVTDYLQKEVGPGQYTVLANRVRNSVDQYRTYEQLHTTLSWYQQLVEQELAGIYLVQGEEFVYINGRFAEIFGYTQAELIGESVLTIVDEADTETVMENIRRREIGEVETLHYSWTGVTKEGNQLTVDAQGGRIEFGGDPAILGMLVDITREGM